MSRFTEHFNMNAIHSKSSLSLDFIHDVPPTSPTSSLSSCGSSSSTHMTNMMMTKMTPEHDEESTLEDHPQNHEEQVTLNKKLSVVKRFITGTIRRSHPNSSSRPSLVIN